MANSPKRAKSINDASENIEKPANIQEVNMESTSDLEMLDSFQSQLDLLQDELTSQMYEIEAKYCARKTEIYKKRSEVIQKINGFWRLTISNHPELASMIDQTSEEVLQYLTDLYVETDDEDRTFRIILIFNENPFFYNKSLIKTYKILRHKDNDYELEIIPAKIVWKEGKEIPIGSKPLRTFLSWLQVEQDKDLHIAECIKDDIFSNPLLYYLLKDSDDGTEENSDENAENEEMDDVLIVETDDEGDNSIFEVDDSESSDVCLIGEEEEENKTS